MGKDREDCIETDNTPLVQAMKRVRYLENQLAEKSAQLARAEEVLRFYADQDNWSPTPSDSTPLWAYTTIYKDSTSCDTLTGGKRAREYFKAKR